MLTGNPPMISRGSSPSVQGRSRHKGKGEGKHAALRVIPFTLYSLLFYRSRTRERAKVVTVLFSWRRVIAVKRKITGDFLARRVIERLFALLMRRLYSLHKRQATIADETRAACTLNFPSCT